MIKNKQHELFTVIVFIVSLICLFSDGFCADPIVFNDNGVWCWFQDERAIVHNGKLIVGSVSNSGDIDVVEYDINTSGPAVKTVLHSNFQADDHAAPAFVALPDDRILTLYAKHGNDAYIRYRATTNPNDTTSWDSEQTYTAGAGVTYSNVYRLSAENGGSGRIYDFYRGENYNPNFVTSDDNGQTWTYGLAGVSKDGRLIVIGTGGTRPYVRYTSNNVDKIHFITTEAHPRNYDNSIYYGYLYQGDLYQADGTWLHDTASGGVAPSSLEKIYQGGVNNVAWTTDIDLDAAGNPYFAFSVQMNQDMNDLRYWYARWDGTQWHVHEIAYAGSALYSAESDYTGLVALAPSDPDVLYISADVDPVTGDPLISTADSQRHYEIFRGTTTDMGATWQWEYITKNSTEDNIRPIIPEWDGGTILLWLKGTYNTYTSYNMDVVGLFDPQPVITGEPEITVQPNSAAAPIGGNASFSVQATGQSTLAYEWFKVNSGGDIQVGGNSNTLTLDNIQSTDFGQYYCTVSNTLGTVESDSVNLMEANLDAYWPMESNFVDATGNGYDASASGSPMFTSGVFSGRSVSLTGDSYLTCANSSILTLKDGGTVSVWIKTDALDTAWATVVAKGQLGWRLSRNDETDAASFQLNSASQEYQTNGDIPVVDSTWHHLVAVYDLESIALYVDGVLDAVASTPEAVSELSELVYIGSQPYTPTGTVTYVDAEGGSGGNTARPSDGDVDAWWTTTRTDDSLWQRRTIFGNDADYLLGNAGSDIFESTGTTGAEDVVQVVTTITGLNPGETYKVDVIYWSAAGQNWSIQAGFAPDAMLYYDSFADDGATAGTPTGKTEADRTEYAGLLGYAEADVNGEIEVYVDDRPGGGASYYDRCWYDGLLVEEITSGSVLGLFWEGQIDEVRIYNFAMDQAMVQLLNEQNLSCYRVNSYDLTGDCLVNLDDLVFFTQNNWLLNGGDLNAFTDLASAWLECDLIPTSDCLH